MRLERPSSITRAARACGLLLLAAAPSACAPQPTTNIPDAFQLDVSLEDRVFSCDPLRFDPSMPRVATERAITLRVSGGSGLAPLRIEGETLGAFVEAGGGFRAGSRAGRVTVLATDSNCNLQARTTVEIVGPFSVTPARATVARGAMTTFTAQNVVGPLRFEIFARPAGAGAMGSITAAGVFTAGAVDGEYQIVATDDGAQKSARVVVEVGAGTPLRPRAALLAVASGERAPLEWFGGSGSYRYTVSDMSRGRVVQEGAAAFFEATGAPGPVDVTVNDMASSETARVRVLVGETIAPAPQRRGLQTQAGDLAVGDVNGDRLPDLIIGHAERSIADLTRRRFTGRNAGGILVHHGEMGGGFAAMPSTILEGENTEDRFGSVLLVRDVNADSFDDVLVGVPDSDLGESDRGAFALHLGSRDGLTPEFERVLNGEDINDRFGSAIAVADLNGDMAPELIVGAPNAVRPMDRPRVTAARCNGGRVYVYRGIARSPGAPPVRGVFENVPWQVIDVQAPRSDTDAPPACSPFLIGAGRAVALIDVDNDDKLDLAVGAPNESHVAMGTASVSHGVVLVYRGVNDAQFERFPAWSIQLPVEQRVANQLFGQALDVIRDGMTSALVVRSSNFNAPGAMMGTTVAAAGGMWVFTRAQFPAPNMADAMGVRPVRIVSASSAQTFAFGEIAQRGLGRHASVGDTDGDGAPDYIVSGTAGAAAAPAVSGAVYSFSVRSLLTGTGAVMLPTRIVSGAMPMPNTVPTELTGMRVAAIPAAMGMGAGLAVWHGFRDTMIAEGATMVLQPFAGSIEYVGPGAGALAPRWDMAAARRNIVLPMQASGDRAGTVVALGSLSSATAVDAVVGAPFSHSTATMTVRAAQLASVGATEVYPSGGRTPTARYAKAFASGIASPTISLDFDGDGTQELAVAERVESVDSRLMEVPAQCRLLGTAMGTGDAGVTRTPQLANGRGIVHVYKLMGGQLVERWRVITRQEVLPLVAGALQGVRLNGFGASIAAADVDGDGRDDLVVGRPGGTDSNGAEVVLGRENTGASVMYACNAGDAFTVGPNAPTDTTFFGTVVDGIGDINGDRCDEIAISLVRNAAGTNPSAAARTGFLLVFGSNSDAGRTSPPACAFRRPMSLYVVADERNFADNVAGDVSSRVNDVVDLPGVPSTMGRVFALGAGDLDGDRVPDVVYRSADLAFGPFRGPAVEILSGRTLATCVSSACPAGAVRDAFVRDGDYMAIGVRTLGAPHRLVVPAQSPIVTRWGSSIALADVTRDSVAELFVGSPDESFGGDFAGAVIAYRGGTALTQAALTGDPWLIAVGATRERGDFGASVASMSSSAGSFLLVGSPLASRGGAGGELGAGYRWRVEVP
jgi:hypothetical protein